LIAILIVTFFFGVLLILWKAKIIPLDISIGIYNTNFRGCRG